MLEPRLRLAINTMAVSIQRILADAQPSIYLYGSVTTGDFRPGWSDIDLLVLTADPITADQADALLYLRQALAGRDPATPYYRLFEGGKPVRNLHYVCAENFHSRNVGGLFFDVYGAHIDVALQPKIRGGGGKRNAVLSRARFRNHLFLAHIFSKKCFAHTMIKLVRARVIEVLALDVKLNVPKRSGQPLQIGNGGGSALKFSADTP